MPVVSKAGNQVTWNHFLFWSPIPIAMNRRFVVISGLPGSGKSTLAQRLAPRLGLTLLDKDTILERLFESKGTGDRAWRRALSRESDAILQSQAAASQGAVLVSHWHLPGMAAESGTPTGWLAELPGNLVHVYCACDPLIAAGRFIQRERHPGHRDSDTSRPEVLAGIREVARMGRLALAPTVVVQTEHPPELEDALSQILSVFERSERRSDQPPPPQVR
jgi:adenylate kinase